MQPYKQGPSWIVVAIAFFIFWPVGVYLLYKKVNSDRSAVMQGDKNKMMYLVALLLLLIGVRFLLELEIVFSVFFIAGGMLIFKKAQKNAVTGEHYRVYIDCIVNQNTTAIDTIAGMAGVSYDQCLRDLQEMISHGYFHDARIDLENRRIVIDGSAYAAGAAPGAAMTAASAAGSAQPIQCNSCGANYSAGTGTAVCEYCGSALR